MPPSIARPTVPGLASASAAECQTGMPVSVEPKYSCTTAPHQSIIARLTCGGQGAAPWTMKRSDDRSYRRFTSSGSRSSRTNMVGTMCMWVMRWRAISCSMSSGSKRGSSTIVQPLRNASMP